MPCDAPDDVEIHLHEPALNTVHLADSHLALPVSRASGSRPGPPPDPPHGPARRPAGPVARRRATAVEDAPMTEADTSPGQPRIRPGNRAEIGTVNAVTVRVLGAATGGSGHPTCSRPSPATAGSTAPNGPG